jgi:galactose mutarotase-like enzyme
MSHSESTIRISEEQGFRLVHLGNEALEVTVVPELGSRLFSLRDLRLGREWLWRRGGDRTLWRNSPGDPFPEGTFSGADECLPTIGACTWNGRELPDHGEIWSLPWSLEEKALSSRKIRTSVSLPLSPLSLTRELSLTGSTLRMEYTLLNEGTAPEAWLWAWHPLFTLEQGDRLELPDQVKRLTVETARHPDALRGTIWEWPSPAPGVQLDQLGLQDDDAYMKAFAGPLHWGEARLANDRSGTSLTLRWDAESLPFLGIWLTRGGYQGWHHVALEPTNLPAETLAEGCRLNPDPFLAPGGTQKWWMEIQLGIQLNQAVR